MAATSDGQRMAAGLKAIARLEAQRAAEARHAADVAAARPAPPAITDRPGRGDRVLAQSVKCPACLAQVGIQCHSRTRSQKPIAFHPSRLDAVRAAQPADLSSTSTSPATNQPSEGS